MRWPATEAAAVVVVAGEVAVAGVEVAAAVEVVVVSTLLWLPPWSHIDFACRLERW
jgi:hypothetical protein